MMLHDNRFRTAGDRVLIAMYGETIDKTLNLKVLQLAHSLTQLQLPGIEAVVPSYCSLAIHYDPLVITVEAVIEQLNTLESTGSVADNKSSKIVEIPVAYGGEFGPDIEFVAAAGNLTTMEVIARHSAPAYHIYAIGFAPGFCYLGGLDPLLHTPRLSTPRLHVAAGSVGIAGGQTGVYPLASPGGWRLIGRTPLRLFDPNRQDPIPYKAGDAISFCPISADEFYELQQKEE